MKNIQSPTDAPSNDNEVGVEKSDGEGVNYSGLQCPNCLTTDADNFNEHYIDEHYERCFQCDNCGQSGDIVLFTPSQTADVTYPIDQPEGTDAKSKVADTETKNKGVYQ